MSILTVSSCLSAAASTSPSGAFCFSPSNHWKLEPRLLDGALLLEHLHRLDCRSAVYLQQESHKKLDEKLQASTNFPGPHSRMTESPLDQGFSGLESSPRPRLIARCKNFEKTYFYI